MKRWNFSGQEASHGNSKAHRLPGSIGMCEYPGRVFKGKKMAGQLGNRSATVLNQRIIRIDVKKNLIYLMGNTPGAVGALVRVRDAIKKAEKQYWDLYYPSFLPSQEVGEDDLIWDGNEIDPYEQWIHENDVVSGTKDDGD
uniref:Large ribosomal subunit protein uL3c n=1 Tax=Strombidium rassoulzadegani TaxID=1082188 RepID=A0A7S3CLM7_9SPIT|mmetsp:Transcript_13035/g.22007  ORF Transcript_13035/g.22007 Transcript_13035/m.22007 type:complete len:141 (+) Transcript_13035:705-1127(+)